MPDRIRNYSQDPIASPPRSYIVETRPARPYAATGGYYGKVMPLTEKEKAARAQSRTASFGTGPSFGNSVFSASSQFYSAPLSTDFLELPQSPREKRELYRHFYRSDELVGQAIDTHVELLLSKTRLAPPRPRSCPPGFDSPEDYGNYIQSRFKKMCERTKLFQRLISMLHHYWLDGGVVVFAEDSGVEIPWDVGHHKVPLKTAVMTEDGTIRTHSFVEKATIEDDEREYYMKNYQGWKKLVVLPIDRCVIESASLSDRVRIQLIPSKKDHELIMKAENGDEMAADLISEIPDEVREYIKMDKPIPLGSDPTEGSFAFLLTARRFADEPVGFAILDRCIRTLIKRDKLRQAQTSIASRAMTPRRIVWADGLSNEDTDILREQVDLALQDPDYSVVANYELHWEEQSPRDRLLDNQAENEADERRLIIGLGVTESLMSGESLFSGDRFKLHVINQKYLQLRELIQEYVEDNLFKPVAERMGFVELNKWGEPEVLYPKLAFNRLPLQDSQDFFDAVFNMYTKGSISVDIVLELLNIDPYQTEQKVRADMMGPNDPVFNEVLRGAYGEVGRLLPEKTNMLEKIAEVLRLRINPEAPQEEDSGGGGFNRRFANRQAPRTQKGSRQPIVWGP